MISCLREWISPNREVTQWPTLPLECFLPPGATVRWYTTGRAALFQALQPLAGKSTGTALVPGYIAAGVVDSLRAVGFRVRFVPSGPGLIANTAPMEEIIRTDPSVRLVVGLHPMGRVVDFGGIQTACRDRNVLLVEDCAQALFCRDVTGRAAGTQGDLALFSFTKYFGCLDGAAMACRNPSLPLPEQPRQRKIGIRLACGCYALHLLATRSMHESPRPSVGQMLLRASGFFYDCYYLYASRDFRGSAPSRISARQLAGVDLERVISQRRKNTALLYARLQSRHLRFVYPDDHAGWIPMAVPALAEGCSREELVKRAMKKNILLASLTGRWDFIPPGPEFNPERDYLGRHVLIPVGEHLDDERMGAMVDLLNTL